MNKSIIIRTILIWGCFAALSMTLHAQQQTYKTGRVQFKLTTAAQSPTVGGNGVLFYRNTDSLLCVRNPDGTLSELGGNNTAVWRFFGTNFYGGRGAGAALAAGATFNFLGGDSTGNALTTGDENTFVGQRAGKSATTALYNTGIGGAALKNITTGQGNVAAGYRVLYAVTTGTNNVAIGANAGELLTTGVNNIFIGQAAGNAQTTGNANVFIGHGAGTLNTTGQSNTFVGTTSGQTLTTGSRNTFLGSTTGNLQTTASDNTLIGFQSGDVVTTSKFNTAVGSGALGAMVAADSASTAIGYNALLAATGGENVAVGSQALVSLTTARRTTAIGEQAGSTITTGPRNTIVGWRANVSGATVKDCVILGDSANANGNGQFIVASGTGITNAYIGRGVVDATPAAFTLQPTGENGADQAGVAINIAGGKATGNAVGGSIVFQTSDAGGSGSTLQSLTTKVTVDAAGDINTTVGRGVNSGTDTDMWAGFYPTDAGQALSGEGVVNVTSYYCAWTTTAADTSTMAAGTQIGQRKKVKLVVDGGDGRLVITGLSGGTAVTFNDAGDYIEMLWNGTSWFVIENFGATISFIFPFFYIRRRKKKV